MNIEVFERASPDFVQCSEGQAGRRDPATEKKEAVLAAPATGTAPNEPDRDSAHVTRVLSLA